MTCFAKEAFRSWPACLPFWLPPGRGIQVSASGYGFCWRSEWRPGSTFPIIAVLPAPSRHFWRLRLRKQSLLPSSAGSGSSSSIRPRHAVKMNGAAPCTTPDTGGIPTIPVLSSHGCAAFTVFNGNRSAPEKDSARCLF